MALLDGGIASIFGAVFGGVYLDGMLIRSMGQPIYNNEGVITGYTGGTSLPIKCQVDAADYAMRQSEGFVDGDSRIIVLSAGLSATINTDHRITVGGQTWLVQSVERDAAASHYVCRGRRA